MNGPLSGVDARVLAFPLRLALGAAGLLVIVGIAADLFVLGWLRRRPLNSTRLRERLAARPWGWRESILVGLVLGACFLVMQSLAAVLYHWAAAWSADFVIRMQTVVFQAAAVATVIFIMRVRGLSWRSAFGLRRSGTCGRVAQGIFVYVAAVPVVAFYAFAWAAFLRLIGIPAQPQLVVDILCDPSEPMWFRAYLVLLAIVTAPFVEEILFRGIALPTVAKRLSPLTSMCLVSLLFAFIHGNTASVVPLFVFGMALALAYTYTGSLLVPIVMHAMFNAASITLLFLLHSLSQAVGN